MKYRSMCLCMLDDGGAPTNWHWFQLIRDDYIEDSITQQYMEFDEDRRGESRFWDHTFPQAEFAKDGIVHDSID